MKKIKEFFKKKWNAFKKHLDKNRVVVDSYAVENGKFFGLPIFNEKNHRNTFAALLFEIATGLFFPIFIYLLVQWIRFWIYGDWKYFQSVEKYYFEIICFMLLALILGNFVRIAINYLLWFSQTVSKYLLIAYIVFSILLFIIINEIWGL